VLFNRRLSGIYFVVTKAIFAFLGFLSQEQGLLCVPLPIEYHRNAVISQGTTYSGDQYPTEIRLWDDLFEEVN
jgi:hypothetical protein